MTRTGDEPDPTYDADEAGRELALMGIDPGRYGLPDPPTVVLRAEDAAPARATPPAATTPVRPTTVPASRAVVPSPATGVARARPAVGPSARTTGTGVSRPVPPAPAPDPLAVLPRLAPAPPRRGPEAARRVLRAVTLGLATGASAATVDRERDLVAAVRDRRPGPEVLVVLSGKGGVGATTTAAGVGLTVAALRGDEVRLVDARCGTPSLGHRLVGRPAPTIEHLLAAGDAGQPAALPAVRGLRIVDGAPWYQPVGGEQLGRLLTGVGESGGTTLLDVGNDTGELARHALDAATRILVVADADQDALPGCRIAFSRAFRTDPALAAGAVVALVCRSWRGYRGVARTVGTELGAARVVPVPYDPTLGAGGRLQVDRLRSATRAAYLELAALLAAPGRSR